MELEDETNTKSGEDLIPEKSSRVIHRAKDGPTLGSLALERASKRNRNLLVHQIRESGEEYKPRVKGARGDISIPGRPQPHAFIQLNPLVNFFFILGFKKETSGSGFAGF